MVSGGTSAARGFEYQIEASIWIALELMLKSGRAQSVEIEPLNAEDLEAVLQPDEVMSTLSVGGGERRVLYQMKTRGNGPWSESLLGDIVGNGVPRPAQRSGQPPRALALELLRKDNHREAAHRNIYFFISNAAVDNSLHRLNDQQLVLDTSTEPLPQKWLAPELRSEAHLFQGRVRLLSGTTRELIRFRTERLVNFYAKVPQSNIDDCIQTLTYSIRQRLLGEAPSTFTKKDLRDLLQAHGGMRSAAGLAYVAPKSIAHFEQVLQRQHALLVLGEAGVGKTSLAGHLKQQYESASPPFRIVHVVNSPAEFWKNLEVHGPTLFIVADPWGNSHRRDDSMIASTLDDMVRNTSSDKRMIITSRRDIYEARSQQTNNHIRELAVTLEASDYDKDSLWEMVLAHAELSPHQHDLVAPHRMRIQKELILPMTLMCFGVRLKALASELTDNIDAYMPDCWLSCDEDHSHSDINSKLIDRLISMATDDVLGDNTSAALPQFPHYSVEHAMLFWLLCEARGGPVDLLEIRQLAAEMNGHWTVQIAVSEYTNFLVATGIAQKERQDGYEAINIHSSALAQMLLLAKKHPTRAAHTITTLAQVFMARQQADNNLHYCFRTIQALNHFAEELPTTSGWDALVDTVDRTIRKACRVLDHDPAVDIADLAEDVWYRSHQARKVQIFREGVDASMMWSWAKSPLLRFLRGLSPENTSKSPTTARWRLDQKNYCRRRSQVFLERFILHYLPYRTRLNEEQIKALITVAQQFNLELQTALQQALRLIEYRSCTENDDWSGSHDPEPRDNLEPLRTIHDALYVPAYRLRFPPEPLGAFNPMKPSGNS